MEWSTISGVSAIRRHNYIPVNFCSLLQTQPCQKVLGFHRQGGSNKPHTFVTKSGSPACFVFLFTISPSTPFFWIALICFACLGRELPWFSVRAVFVLLACLGWLFSFLNTYHVLFHGHALARKKEPTLGVWSVPCTVQIDFYALQKGKVWFMKWL